MTKIERRLIALVAQYGNLADASEDALVHGVVGALCDAVGHARVAAALREWMQVQEHAPEGRPEKIT